MDHPVEWLTCCHSISATREQCWAPFLCCLQHTMQRQENGHRCLEWLPQPSLCESDCHLTMFITPGGRFWNKRTPKHFLSSDNGYNCRFDAKQTSHENECVVGDTQHNDKDLLEHWWRTKNLLTLVGNSGIVLNPEKFQFAQKEVDFASFLITPDTINLLPKYFSTIWNSPTPALTTDICC